MSETIERFNQHLDHVRPAQRARLKSVWANATPKERLNLLVDAGLLSSLQRRRVAQAMDASVREGVDPAVAMVACLEGLESGELQVPDDAKKRTVTLTLDALRSDRPGLGQKQELLELRNAGSITPDQTRRAAGMITKGDTIESALFHVGAEHLLATVPAGLEGPDAQEDDEEASGGGQEGGEEGDVADTLPSLPDGVEEAPRGADEVEKNQGPRTIGEILDLSVREIVDEHLPNIRHKPAALELIAKERAGKTRTTLLPELTEHALALGAERHEIEEALASETGETPEKAYRRAMGVVDEWDEDDE